MKRYLILCAIVLTIGPQIFAQQDSEFGSGNIDSNAIQQARNFELQKRFLIKTNPLAMISGDMPGISSEFRLLMEWVSSPKTSMTFGVSYLGMGVFERIAWNTDPQAQSLGLSAKDFSFNGFRLQLGVKYYLRKKGSSIMDIDFVPAPKGWYIQPLGSYSNAKYFQKGFANDFERYVHWSLTLNFGYQFLWGKRWVFDPFAGVGYKSNTISDPLGNPLFPYSPDSFARLIYDNNLKINLGFNVGLRF